MSIMRSLREQQARCVQHLQMPQARLAFSRSPASIMRRASSGAFAPSSRTACRLRCILALATSVRRQCGRYPLWCAISWPISAQVEGLGNHGADCFVHLFFFAVVDRQVRPADHGRPWLTMEQSHHTGHHEITQSRYSALSFFPARVDGF